MGTDFLIKRDDIRQTKFTESVEPTELMEGEVLFKVDEFAFTANNVTYAAVGEYLKYWHFFPSGEEGWGKLPVWGYGDVIASAHEEIKVGERMYGYWPLASHLKITAVNVTPHSLADGVPHRQALNPIYNQYVRVQNAPNFAPKGEYLNSLLRPMFTTSFLVDDFIDDNDLFGAEMLILSSASSKTGYGTAFMHAQNRSQRRSYEIIGLTSAPNVSFVQSLGCYDRILTYEEVETLPTDKQTVYVDFSGNGRLRHTVHSHFGDDLRYDCAIGLTAWDMQGTNRSLPGVPASMFFAPSQIQKRRHEWGGRVFQEKLDKAFAEFLDFAGNHIEVEVQAGETAVQTIYQQMVEGTAAPKKGFILSL